MVPSKNGNVTTDQIVNCGTEEVHRSPRIDNIFQSGPSSNKNNFFLSKTIGKWMWHSIPLSRSSNTTIYFEEGLVDYPSSLSHLQSNDAGKGIVVWWRRMSRSNSSKDSPRNRQSSHNYLKGVRDSSGLLFRWVTQGNKSWRVRIFIKVKYRYKFNRERE